MTLIKPTWWGVFFIFNLLISYSIAASDPPDDWQRRPVDWRITNGMHIKAVVYPPKNPPLIFDRGKNPRKSKPRKEVIPAKKVSSELLASQTAGSIITNIIDSPPLDGFVAWVAISLTDERLSDLELDAVPESFVAGNFLTGNPQSDYAIGIYDTGAGINLMGYTPSLRAGLDASYITDSVIEIGGVTGSIDAQVTYPLGLFTAGLGAIDPDTLLLDTSALVGESNTSIAAGYEPLLGEPDLPTVVGSPMAVYCAAEFRNDQPITIIRDANEYTSPQINIYNTEDPAIPTYPNTIALSIKPSGDTVAYWPTVDLETGELYPLYPSMIIGASLQSLIFASSINLSEGVHSLSDKDGFIVDTGAQVTVISTAIAGSLGLSTPEFWVKIQGVNGQTVMKPGYYLDSLEITAVGEWLSFTNVPVVQLDVASPELTEDFLDGIIGMNLFVNTNFILRGEAFDDFSIPRIEYELIPAPKTADMAPSGGDGIVDILDLAAVATAWMSEPGAENWDERADIAPAPNYDNKVNLLDLAEMARHWLDEIGP